MTKLQYVGFNGYHQCPKNENSLPKVITNWISLETDKTLQSCNHRFTLLECKDFFEINGVLNAVAENTLQELPKLGKTDAVGSCDKFLVVSDETNIWKYNYERSKWMECELKFLKEEEKCAWTEAGNRISKFSFQQNGDLILLLSSGSVWKLSDHQIKLLFSNDLEKAVDISSGLEHSLILTESGCVLAFGNGSRGQLGHGDLNATQEPVQIAALEGLTVKKIATGAWHSCSISDSGDLYTWGWNNCGQLSAFEDGKQVGLTAVPTVVEVNEELDVNVANVACGSRHTVAVLENGDVYSTGWNSYSQLGINVSCEKISKFTKTQSSTSKNGKVICGPWYTILIED